MLMKCNWKALTTFMGGVLFGTAGVKVLTSSDAKKFYTNCTAAALRAKDCVMTTTTAIQENAEDILAEAKAINAARKGEEVCFEPEESAEAEEAAGAKEPEHEDTD